MPMIVVASISCIAQQRLRIQGESFTQPAFFSILSIQINFLHKTASFTTPPYLLNLGVVAQEAQGKASTKTSILQLDYAYIKLSQDKEPTTILTWVETLTGLAGSLITTKKGPTAQQLAAVVTFI